MWRERPRKKTNRQAIVYKFRYTRISAIDASGCLYFVILKAGSSVGSGSSRKHFLKLSDFSFQATYSHLGVLFSRNCMRTLP